MGPAFYYISRYHGIGIQGEAPQYQSEILNEIWSYSSSHNLVNIKGLWKKLIESEKFTRISERHQQ